MAAAFVAGAAMLVLAVILSGPGLALHDSAELRTRLLAASLMAPAVSLFACIARLAKHRFFTPEDINGSGLTQGTARARLLQALLQNTLEQLALALPVYMSASFIYPGRFLGAIPAAAAAFLVGRVLFFVTYSKGAPSRALGFALTFYPTVFLGVAAVLFLFTRGVP